MRLKTVTYLKSDAYLKSDVPRLVRGIQSLLAKFNKLILCARFLDAADKQRHVGGKGSKYKQTLINGFIFCFLGLTACSFAPKYHRPAMPIPATYKEVSADTKDLKWVPVSPHQVNLLRGDWWKMYDDPILNDLETKVTLANQDIKVAVAHFDAARAELNAARAAYFPKIIGVGNVYRQQLSKNSATGSRATQLSNNGTSSSLLLYNDNLLIGNLYYELDVWGRVRNSVAVAKHDAQASAADIAVIALTLHAELANDYFALRGYDASLVVLRNSVEAYRRIYKLIDKRFRGGVVPAGDRDEAENQYEASKTALADIALKRAQTEHAIAVLIGCPPAAFSLKPTNYHPRRVAIIPNLPSSLLERRPDIAESAARVQAANANIGVARSAYFPQLNLSLGAGLESAIWSNLLNGRSLVWALGSTTATALLNSGNMPLITQIIFDGGRIKAMTQRAVAEYHGTVAAYRQTVLSAFQEVEDNLVAIRKLDQEYHSQTLAVRSAQRGFKQALYRYKEGLTTYYEVSVAENIALQAQLTKVNIVTRRQAASVLLIKALGGGWHCTRPSHPKPMKQLFNLPG